jgi:hypothetical protein
MPDYNTDRRWSNRFIPELKRIVADLVIATAPDVEDMLRNTDLIVLKAEGQRIACRVRRHRYLTRFPFDITVRSERASGAETELAKIVKGFGDYMLYAFASEDETHLCAWRIIDLARFRLWFQHRAEATKGMPGKEQRNGDRASQFLAFDVRDMPANTVVREFGFSGISQPVRVAWKAGQNNLAGGR